MAQYYSKHYDIPLRKIEIMPNWVDLSRFSPSFLTKVAARRQLGLGANYPVFLYVHSVSTRKGADRLVDIMEHLKRRFPQAVLLVVGGGVDEELVLSQVKASAMFDNIRLMGRVPNSQLPTYLASADVFLMPSREEGFPHVLLEAMAMGVPFVATDVGGVRDFSSELQQQFVVTDFTADKFAERVVAILEDPGMAHNLKIDGLRVVQDYSLEKVAHEFGLFWDKCLA